MTKAEAEAAIRYLVHQWAAEQTAEQLRRPSFFSFKEWLSRKGYAHYLSFRSVTGAEYDADMWFNAELKQRWRL